VISSGSSGGDALQNKKTATYTSVDGQEEQLTFYTVLANLKKFSVSYWLIVLICAFSPFLYAVIRL
jgi:hypothetical protein